MFRKPQTVFALGLLTLSAISVPAAARDFALKLESGMGLALSSPQSKVFDPGGGQLVKGLFGLNRKYDVGPSLGFLTMPVGDKAGSGTALMLGAGGRFKRPRDLPGGVKNYGASPWADADLFYIRTGTLSRPGLAIGVGAAMAVGKARTFWLGPFVRYLHIFQFHNDRFEDNDAKTIIFGLSMEIGAGAAYEPTIEICPVAEVKEVAPVPVVLKKAPAKAAPEVDTCPETCPDRDNDTVPDAIDKCPDIVGPLEGAGCPIEKKVVVEPPKLELKQKILFATNKAVIQDNEATALDAVVQALQERATFHIQLEGHAQSVGAEARNKTLSQKRADAAMAYLVAHGVNAERLVAKGLIPSPAATKDDDQRRVEFVIVSDGSSK